MKPYLCHVTFQKLAVFGLDKLSDFEVDFISFGLVVALLNPSEQGYVRRDLENVVNQYCEGGQVTKLGQSRNFGENSANFH